MSWIRRLSKIFKIKKELTDPKLKRIEGVYVYFLQFDLHFDGKVNKVTEMSQFVSLIDGRINARGLGSVQDLNFRWAIQPKLQLLSLYGLFKISGIGEFSVGLIHIHFLPKFCHLYFDSSMRIHKGEQDSQIWMPDIWRFLGSRSHREL